MPVAGLQEGDHKAQRQPLSSDTKLQPWSDIRLGTFENLMSVLCSDPRASIVIVRTVFFGFQGKKILQ